MVVLSRNKFHHIIYLCSLATIAVALPLSLFVMTVGIIALAVNAILEWNWKQKWNLLKNNKLVLLLISFPILYALGFLNTDLWGNGISSYLMKFPLLIIPLVVSTTAPISKLEIKFILLSYIGSLLFTTIYSTIYLVVTPIQDIREISIFISHIRFSLNIVFGIVILLFLLWNNEWKTPKLVPVYFILLCWFVFYLFISQTLTGIGILFILTIFLMFYTLFFKHKTKEIKIVSYLFLLCITIFIIYISGITYDYFHDRDKGVSFETKTSLGNDYTFDYESIIENGHRIGVYVCEKELFEYWQKRSNVPYVNIKDGLIRYLNSKGEKKDAQGIMSLTDTDIHNIELGFANVNYTKGIGLKRSLYPTFFSFTLYYKYGNIHQSSLLERFELWRTSFSIIKSNWLTGVGIGDHKLKLDQQLELQKSEITKKEKGCHNQYITIWLSGGLLVLIPFLMMLIAPFIYHKNTNILYILFFLIITISMLTEDTLDSHAGVTFFAFFNSFLLLIMYPSKQNN